MLFNTNNDANLTLRALFLLTLKGRKVVGGAIVEHFEEAEAPEALVDRYKSSFLEAIARQSLRHPQNIGFCYCCDLCQEEKSIYTVGDVGLCKRRRYTCDGGAHLVQMACQRQASGGVGLLQTSFEHMSRTTQVPLQCFHDTNVRLEPSISRTTTC